MPLVAHNDVDLRIEMRAKGLRTGDSQVLNRVLLNLISNAIHALHDGGKVGVQVTDQDDGYLQVVVSDDGQNVPIEKILSTNTIGICSMAVRNPTWRS